MTLRRSHLPVLGSHRSWLFPVAIALLCGISTARAGADFFVHAYVNAIAEPLTQDADTGEISGPTATAGPLDLIRGDREARIFAQASYGHLSGTAFATNPNGLVAAQATTFADIFKDTITIHSAVLPAGSPVQVLATMTLSDLLFSQSIVSLEGGFALSSLTPLIDRGNDTGLVSSTRTSTFLFTKPVDVPFMIAGQMGFAVSARPGTGEVRMADGRFTLEALTPGVTLTSASGTSYSVAVVPEPSSFVVLASGLCGLCSFGLLRKRILRGRGCSTLRA
jgi:hypothetical protein